MTFPSRNRGRNCLSDHVSRAAPRGGCIREDRRRTKKDKRLSATFLRRQSGISVADDPSRAESERQKQETISSRNVS